MRYKPNKDEFFFKKSSLAVSLDHDDYGNEGVMIYDRRTQRIISRSFPALVTLKDYMELQKILKKRRKK